MKIFSIKNESLEFFNRPIYVESENEALTYIQNILMSDADRALSGLKNDLALYELGEIDFVTGKIVPLDEPVRICGLVDIFNTIPEDRIPQTANALKEMILKLKDELAKVSEEVKSNDACAKCRNYRSSNRS